ncbi:dynamin family protein [Paenibacillus senegalensis]|uniref:dynamin family protein n=1 Tax=Paenibacillus senegalensis TaxID=1465766 RepID=UPI0002D479EC|nr:dynamin family protein [Paenibacillus senegalensis]
MSGEATIIRLAQQMESAGDLANAAKMHQLKKKLDYGQFYIAFCGHFSAGKSSLINQLCGHPLLPSSPIPTSANIVSIARGEPAASIYYNDQEEPLPVLLEQLEEYCKDGDRIRTVAIHYPSPLLTEQTVLLDTPGIDSTDDAHRLATESALHLADVVFYVMDYNHVQSEMNLTFTKHLQEWGKPLYLIVNQIDKHREEELPFEQFARSVKEAFANWNIQPQGIFYLSLREPDHPEQQWQPLIWTLRNLMQMAEDLRQRSARDSAVQLVGDYSRHIAEANQEVKAAWREELSALESPDEAIQAYESNRRKLEELAQRAEQWYAVWKKETDSIIDNANLTPAVTRDLAQHYLDSRKPGFKVGFFNRAAQTAKEIDARLQAFRDDLAEKVQAGLTWHLQSFFKKLVQTHKLSDSLPDSLQDGIQQQPEGGWLASQVHSGAEFSGEYTLNYCRQIASEIKGQYRRAVQELLEWSLQAVSVQVEEEARGLKEIVSKQEQQLAAYHKLQTLENEEQQEYMLMIQQIEQEWNEAALRLPNPADFDREQFLEAESLAMPALQASANAKGKAPGKSAAAVQGASPAAVAVQEAEAGRAAEQVAHEQAALEQVRKQRARMQETARNLREASALIADIASLRSASRSMLEKAGRLETNRFTIALFGAFSAGKSSFANALLGERILPVSPNPTTAAINTILPPAADCPHGTVLVQMKTADKIEEEIRYSLEVLGEDWNGREAALAAIENYSRAMLRKGPSPITRF